jgi:hypothetical protein
LGVVLLVASVPAAATLIATLLACPLMTLSMFATTRGGSASHPHTDHQPTPSRLSPSQMPVDRERSPR